MKLYAVRNAKGEYLARGYSLWTTDLEKIKFYPKIGQAKSRCTYYYNRGYGTIQGSYCVVLEIDIDITKAVVLDQTNHIMAAIDRKKKKEAQRAHEQRMYQSVQNVSKVKELMKTLTPQQKALLNLP